LKGKKSGILKILVQEELKTVVSNRIVQMRYSESSMMWLDGACTSEVGQWIKGLMSLGVRSFRSADDPLKIIVGEPGVLLFPNSDSYLMSTPGCTRSDYQPVHTQVRYRLPSYFGVNEVFREKARVQQRIAYEVKSIAACNSCIAKIQAIRTESPACEFLIDSLFLRDPLEMLPEYLSGRVCKSKCKAMFDLTLHSALEVCSTDWHQRWTSTSYHAILFKQLVMMAAMRYAIHSSALFKQELQRKRSTATSSLCWLYGVRIIFLKSQVLFQEFEVPNSVSLL
jgi:hypothetical protein